jgi:hypothetical protein
MTQLLCQAAQNASAVERTFKDDRRSRVVVVTHAGRRHVLKIHRGNRLVHAARRIVACTAGQRERRAARRLQTAGIRTLVPEIAGYDAALGGEVLIYPHVAAPSLHHAIAQITDAEERRRVAASVGRQIGMLINLGWSNRDHKPSNLLIDVPCRAGDQPILIDPVGLRRSTSPPRVTAMFDLLQRAADRAGCVSLREKMTSLRSAIAVAPVIAGSRRAADVARDIARRAR